MSLATSEGRTQSRQTNTYTQRTKREKPQEESNRAAKRMKQDNGEEKRSERGNRMLVNIYRSLKMLIQSRGREIGG